MRTSILRAFCCIAAIFPQHLAFADTTTRSAPQMVDLPGNPFAVTASRDGNWVFVTVFAGGDQGGGDRGCGEQSALFHKRHFSGT